MASTTALAKQLDDAILPDFADLFVMEDAVAKIEKTHDLDDPAVIAALATCADLGPVQKRLIARPASALVDGLTRATTTGKLRDTARVLAQTLLGAARNELVASPAPASGKRTKRPAFATPQRLPMLIRDRNPIESPGSAGARSVAEGQRGVEIAPDATDALLDQLAAGAVVDVEAYLPASRVAFGRALVFGWLAYGAEPKARWAALAAAPFLDDATAADVAKFAHAIASRVGQFAKAQALVDVLAAMSTRGALAALDYLATHVDARAVQDRAKAALQQAAVRMDMTAHDLADRLMGEPAKQTTKPVDAAAFVRRLEERMLSGAAISMRELVESILQNPVARQLAGNVVFAAGGATFVITADRLENAVGTAVEPASDALVSVIYPTALSAADRKAWSRCKLAQPFPQLARKVPALGDVAELRLLLRKFQHSHRSANELYALEPLGWKRGPLKRKRCTTLVRELDGLTATLSFRPGLAARTPSKQTIVGIELSGTPASPTTLQQIARELELLSPLYALTAHPTSRA